MEIRLRYNQQFDRCPARVIEVQDDYPQINKLYNDTPQKFSEDQKKVSYVLVVSYRVHSTFDWLIPLDCPLAELAAR